MTPFHVNVRALKRKRIIYASIIIFALTSGWFGAKLFQFMTDYRDERIALRNFKIKIKEVEAKDNDTFAITVFLNNSHPRDLLILTIAFSVFENNTEGLVMTGMIDYTKHAEGLNLRVGTKHTETFTKQALTQLKHDTPIQVRVNISTLIQTKYYSKVRSKTGTNATLTFY